MNRFSLRANPNPAFKLVQPLPSLDDLPAELQAKAALYESMLQPPEHDGQTKFPAAALRVGMFPCHSESRAA